MTSQMLLKIASGMFVIAAVGHAAAGFTQIFKEADSIKDREVRHMTKSVWQQMSGYLVLASLLCWKWAGYGLETSIDRTSLSVLAGITGTAGLDYVRKGKYLPPMGLLPISGLLIASQLM